MSKELLAKTDVVGRREEQDQRVLHMVELPVNRELGPFLVSSTRSVAWVDRVSRESRVRAAVRPRRGLEQDIVTAVLDLGTRLEWGNVHPMIQRGVDACVAHLREYGFEEIECLASAATTIDVDLGPTPLEVVGWMPIDCLVFVPTDRSFVGSLASISPNECLALVHNASRGIAIAWR